jgi:hypothetical protein
VIIKKRMEGVCFFEQLLLFCSHLRQRISGVIWKACNFILGLSVCQFLPGVLKPGLPPCKEVVTPVESEKNIKT